MANENDRCLLFGDMIKQNCFRVRQGDIFAVGFFAVARQSDCLGVVTQLVQFADDTVPGITDMPGTVHQDELHILCGNGRANDPDQQTDHSHHGHERFSNGYHLTNPSSVGRPKAPASPLDRPEWEHGQI